MPKERTVTLKKNHRIYITNHDRMPAKAFVQRLKEDGFTDLLLRPPSELDLLDQRTVSSFFKKERPDFVILTSVKYGGIKANIDSPAEFLYENLQAQINVIHSSKEAGVARLLFVAASCIYPRRCPQPMKEEYLFTGELEKTSEPYALAKLSGIKMCEYYRRQYDLNFICAVPATIYGPADDFDPVASHVIPALIRKIHEAKIKKEPSVTIWGSGRARREFIYADDFVDAALFLMENYNGSDVVNVGAGSDISIKELAHLISDIVGFKGRLIFDRAKPEGAMRKLLDVTKLHRMGWKEARDLRSGIASTYQHYVSLEKTRL